MAELEELQNGLSPAEDAQVEDEAAQDETVASVHYDITSFGIDFDGEGIVRRLRRKEVLIPPFQRNYIWNLVEASRFVESLLLGLPIPGIFLAQESKTGELLVIDGQHRLKSLLFFYDGVFDPSPNDALKRVFRLTNIQKEFEGCTYETLEERDRITLDNSVIHATIVRQEDPPDGDTSMYHIFERLDRGGRRLYPQEMRSAIYHGLLIDTIKSLNEHDNWRAIFGKVNPRLKDQELILRFLALYFNSNKYQRPMDEFLSGFAKRYREPGEEFLNEASNMFINTVDAFKDALGRRAFRPGQAINAAVFDSMTVGLARRIHGSGIPNPDQIVSAHADLLKDSDYMEAVSRSTGDKGFVFRRLDKATKRFAEL